jgi:hypothetical protein
MKNEDSIKSVIENIRTLNENINNQYDFLEFFELFYNFTKYHKFLYKNSNDSRFNFINSKVLKEDIYCPVHGKHKIILRLGITIDYHYPKLEIINEYENDYSYKLHFTMIYHKDSHRFGISFERDSYYYSIKDFKILLEAINKEFKTF